MKLMNRFVVIAILSCLLISSLAGCKQANQQSNNDLGADPSEYIREDIVSMEAKVKKDGLKVIDARSSSDTLVIEETIHGLQFLTTFEMAADCRAVDKEWSKQTLSDTEREALSTIMKETINAYGEPSAIQIAGMQYAWDEMPSEFKGRIENNQACQDESIVLDWKQGAPKESKISKMEMRYIVDDTFGYTLQWFIYA